MGKNYFQKKVCSPLKVLKNKSNIITKNVLCLGEK